MNFWYFDLGVVFLLLLWYGHLLGLKEGLGNVVG